MRAFDGNAPEMANKPEPVSGWSYATSLGPWGVLFSAYYKARREELPNEKKFWRSLVKPDASVLEIGAGTGFISQVLAEANPAQLTLVEPEKENIKLLEMEMPNWKTDARMQIIPTQFENANVYPHDFICFPYDSLPMITSKAQRAELIKKAADCLSPNGIFVLHVSTPVWAEKYIESTRWLSVKKHMTVAGEIEVRRFSKRVSQNEYIKFFSLISESRYEQENYVDPTSIVHEKEILAAAANAGLTVVRRYGDFYKGPRQVNSDEDIFIFAKENN